MFQQLLITRMGSQLTAYFFFIKAFNAESRSQFAKNAESWLGVTVQSWLLAECKFSEHA
jgi:hypothetical protein